MGQRKWPAPPSTERDTGRRGSPILQSAGSKPRQRLSPPHQKCSVAGAFSDSLSGLLVYFFFPLATALAFGTSLGAETLLFGFIPSFQLLETLKPIR